MMAAFQPYAKYRDSGIEWARTCPDNWDVIPTFAACRENRRTNFSGAISNVLSLSYGRIIRRDVEANFGLLPESFNTYQIVQPGHVVMRLTDLQNDKRSLRVGFVEEEGIITSAYLGLQFNKRFDRKYAYYLLHAYDLYKVYYGMGGGLRQTMKFSDLKCLPLFCPPLPEQENIAAFLEHETAKIDRLIAKQERLIELLKEKRQAVISHAVTKGLNPDAPMKDSGIEWLGEVPAHWEVSRLKRLTSLVGGFAFSSDDFQEDGIQLLRIGNVYLNKLSLERQPVFLDSKFLDSHSGFTVNKGDIIISLTGTLGKRDYGYAVSVDDGGPFLLNQRVGKLRPFKAKALPEFLLRLLHSESYLAQLYSLPFGTKQANLGNDDVLNVYVVFPPDLNEQVEIVKWIEGEVRKLEELMHKCHEAIRLMQEHRAALISAAVTGKIDVRRWQQPGTKPEETATAVSA